MRTRVLSGRDIESVVAEVGADVVMDDVITEIRRAALEFDPVVTSVQERAGFHYVKPDLGLVEWMPAMELGRAVSIKTVGYHPTNPTQRVLPSVLATTSIYDTSTGQLRAIVDATLLTAIRTGAASAVVTDVLAAEDATTLAVIGSGAQAVTQAHAIRRVRPIETIRAFDTDRTVARSLAGRLPFDVRVEVVDSAEEAIADAAIVCTATTVDIGAGAVVPERGLRPDVHVNAVGADFPGKTELPLAVLQRSLVVTDDRGQCIREGECQQLEESEIGPSLVEIVQGAGRFTAYRRRPTVFDSTGWSLEDLLAAEAILRIAERYDLGHEMELQASGADPYSPYETVLAERRLAD